jgi:hypothetical protein
LNNRCSGAKSTNTLVREFKTDRAKFQREVLVVRGCEYASIPGAARIHSLDCLPHAYLSVIARVGHWPRNEQPQWFRWLVVEFFGRLR